MKRLKLLAVSIALFVSISISGCVYLDSAAVAPEVIGGDINHGQHLIYTYSCGSCHVIPGVAEAVGTVGPPLRGFASRNYIAGLLVNTPENLSHWARRRRFLCRSRRNSPPQRYYRRISARTEAIPAHHQDGRPHIECGSCSAGGRWTTVRCVRNLQFGGRQTAFRTDTVAAVDA